MKRATGLFVSYRVKTHHVAVVAVAFTLLRTFEAEAAPSSVTAIARSTARLASPTPDRSLAIDPSLAEAAARHLREVIADERRANRERIDAALRIEGLADAQLLPFTSIGTSSASVIRELERFAETVVRARGMTHVGVAIHEDAKQVALGAIFARRLVELSPLPRQLRSSKLVVRGRALQDEKLEAVLLGPCDVRFERCTQEAKTLAHQLKNGVLAVPLSLSGPGRYAFEILVTRERGPEVAALWSFDYGKVASFPAKPQLDDLGALVARERNDKELAPLVLDPKLRSAASAYANEVCKTMIAAHVTQESDPTVRAKKAGYPGRVAENVAIASTIAEAHENLMKSPSHRRNVLDPLAAHAGLAVAKSKSGAFCVVELFGFADAQPR